MQADSELGSMKKKIAKLVGQEYWLEQNGQELMRVYGNFTAHDYLMSINGQPVAQVHEKWVSIRDQFGVSITGNVDPRLVLGSVIVVEHLEVTQEITVADLGSESRFTNCITLSPTPTLANIWRYSVEVLCERREIIGNRSSVCDKGSTRLKQSFQLWFQIFPRIKGRTTTIHFELS